MDLLLVERYSSASIVATLEEFGKFIMAGHVIVISRFVVSITEGIEFLKIYCVEARMNFRMLRPW